MTDLKRQNISPLLYRTEDGLAYVAHVGATRPTSATKGAK